MDNPTPFNLKPEGLMYIKKGVLWVQKKPYYVVDLITEGEFTYVMVYKVHPNTEDNPQKLAIEKKTKKDRFNNTSILGQLANTMFPAKVITKWEPKPPVFIAPIIPNQVSTFTGKRESGFFERTEDRLIVEGGAKKYIRGENTGVFIGLSSIEWDSKVSIPTTSLIKALKEQQAGMFFDLQGNNQDNSNPLSTYFNNREE